MPIEFHCTRCNALLRTADDTAGRQAQCPQCGEVLDVPDRMAQTIAHPLPPIPDISQSDNPFVAPGSELTPSRPFDSYEQPTGLATASLVLGILGMVTAPCICIFPLTLFLNILGLVLGVLALNNINAGRAGGKGMAIAGLVCASVGLLLMLPFVFFSSLRWIAH